MFFLPLVRKKKSKNPSIRHQPFEGSFYCGSLWGVDTEAVRMLSGAKVQ